MARFILSLMNDVLEVSFSFVSSLFSLSQFCAFFS